VLAVLEIQIRFGGSRSGFFYPHLEFWMPDPELDPRLWEMGILINRFFSLGVVLWNFEIPLSNFQFINKPYRPFEAKIF
jgi:hypothetical protein